MSCEVEISPVFVIVCKLLSNAWLLLFVVANLVVVTYFIQLLLGFNHELLFFFQLGNQFGEEFERRKEVYEERTLLFDVYNE